MALPAIPIIGGIFDIIGNGFGMLRDWVQSTRELKQKKAEAKIALEAAKVTHANKIAENAQATNAEIDVINTQKDHGWKADWLLFMWSLPLLLSMLPYEWAWAASDRFFARFETAPDHYLIAWGVMFAAIYGYREIVGAFRKGKA